MYELKNYYNVMEIIINDGQKIPVQYEKITVYDYDELHNELKFEAQINRILEKKIINNKIVLVAEYIKLI